MSINFKTILKFIIIILFNMASFLHAESMYVDIAYPIISERYYDLFPDSVFQSCIEGELLFEIQIQPSGNIESVVLLNSTFTKESNINILIQKSICKWKFFPFNEYVDSEYEYFKIKIKIKIIPDAKKKSAIKLMEYWNLASYGNLPCTSYMFNDSLPEIRSKPILRFKESIKVPKDLKKENWDNNLIVDILISKFGKPVKYKVISSIGNQLDKAVIDFIFNNWVFEPATNKKGKPISDWVGVYIYTYEIEYK